MDPRYYHEKFIQTISDCFNEIIKEFKFDIKVDEGKYSGVDLLNSKCIIRFSYDSGFVSSSFVNPEEKAQKEKIIRKDGLPTGYPYYSVFSVWKFLYPNDREDFRYKGMDIEGQALADKRLILARLKNVLNGDFSWTNAYKANDARISKKLEYMTNHWAMDNPVRIKFNEGNPDWEKEFDEYKAYLDNLQK